MRGLACALLCTALLISCSSHERREADSLPVSAGVQAASLDDGERELIIRVVAEEAKGEPYMAQVALCAVILNRVSSLYFPDTVHDVIYEKGEFGCVGTLELDAELDARTRRRIASALDEALEGRDPTSGALYFSVRGRDSTVLPTYECGSMIFGS